MALKETGCLEGKGKFTHHDKQGENITLVTEALDRNIREGAPLSTAKPICTDTSTIRTLLY